MPDDPTFGASLPTWYADIPAGERNEDFHQQVGNANVYLCERGTTQLIVSFGNTQDTDHPELDWPAWTDRLARGKNWSHLAITVDKGTWFRDASLIETLQQLRDLHFFKRFENVVLFGAALHGSGFAALAFAPLCPGAVVLAMDAQSSLSPEIVPWEDRYGTRDATDWSLPYSDASDALTHTQRAYVAYDPLMAHNARHVARLPADKITPLRAFGLNEDIGIALKRLGLIEGILMSAVNGTLETDHWYKVLRARKDLYIYRRIMETHLKDRGKAALSKSFVKAFRRRKRQRKLEESQKQLAAERKTTMPVQPMSDPSLPDAPSSPALAGRRYPRTRGNVWGLRDEARGFRYLSDQYEGRVMGFEERNEVTLGETHPLAIGMAAFGQSSGPVRPLPEDFRYHVVDESLSGNIAAFQAKSHGVIAQRLAASQRHAYRTLIALSAPQSGIIADEALPGSALYDGLMQRIATARTALTGWNKDFHLDRISLSLLSGAPETSLDAASKHYADVAKAMRHDAAIAAGQASFPHFIVSQSAGTATDGRSEVILAEGQLDISHPTLGFVVATPKYPFALMEDMPATLDPTAQMIVDELEVMALAHVQNNQRWHCPAMRQAFGKERTVIVEFSTLSDLILEDGFHGFALQSDGPVPNIQSVDIQGTRARLILDADLSGATTFVTYAWGASRSMGDDGRTANKGAVRDSWAQTSLIAPDHVLHRFALSGRIRVMPSDHASTFEDGAQ